MTFRARLLAFLGERGAATFPEINRAIGGSRAHAWMELKEAMTAGLLQRAGVRRKYVYSLKQGGRRITSVFDLAYA